MWIIDKLYHWYNCYLFYVIHGITSTLTMAVWDSFTNVNLSLAKPLSKLSGHLARLYLTYLVW